MATSLKNLSEFKPGSVPTAGTARFAIVTAEWNEKITFALRDGAIQTLQEYGATAEGQIDVFHVPGSWELVNATDALLATQKYDVVISIGCVIRGDTAHFDYICEGVTQGLIHASLKHQKPVIFGVLTTENEQQALDRAGGIHGNKGVEAAVTALRMVQFNKEL